jgi:predicted enzyme related to lactoylglutathione lyase
MNEPVPGQVTYLEIGSRDAPATRAFFGAVFNWTLHDDAWFQTPTLKAGTHTGDATPQIYVYFHTADLEAAMARVKAAGGEADEPTTEPGFGRFSNCRDPGGIHFGLHQPVTAPVE